MRSLAEPPEDARNKWPGSCAVLALIEPNAQCGRWRNPPKPPNKNWRASCAVLARKSSRRQCVCEAPLEPNGGSAAFSVWSLRAPVENYFASSKRVSVWFLSSKAWWRLFILAPPRVPVTSHWSDCHGFGSPVTQLHNLR